MYWFDWCVGSSSEESTPKFSDTTLSVDTPMFCLAQNSTGSRLVGGGRNCKCERRERDKGGGNYSTTE